MIIAEKFQCLHESFRNHSMPSAIIAHNNKNEFNMFDTFKLTNASLITVSDQVKLHYEKARIPIVDDYNIIKKIKCFLIESINLY